ncbi:MAG: DUF4867 family protein [Culicoidibacterales bacterium]
MDIKLLQQNNPTLTLFDVNAREFAKFGRVITEIDTTKLCQFVEEQTEIPVEGNSYIPSITALEQLEQSKQIEASIYGYQQIQVGICNGNTHQLNALEYHKSPEVNIAVTDMVLLLGSFSDIVDGSYDSAKISAFYIPKGVGIELEAKVLHFAPCSVLKEGFKSIVILPKGTNADIAKPEGTLFKVNKWLYSHKETTRFTAQGAKIGIKGENTKVNY